MSWTKTAADSQEQVIRELVSALNYAVGVLESLPDSAKAQLEDVLDEAIDFERMSNALSKAGVLPEAGGPQ